MIAIILQVIVGILGLAKAYSDHYNSAGAVAKRAEEVPDANIQKTRKTLADNDGPDFDAAAAEQHDRVLAAIGGSSGGGNDPGEKGNAG